MSIKVMMTGVSEALGQVAVRLHEQHGWNVCYIVAHMRLIARLGILDLLPNTVFHNVQQASRGVPAKECQNIVPEPIELPLLEKFTTHQLIALHMMDRMDPGYAFNHQERVRLYQTQWMYWLAVLKHYKPDIVVFHTSPHEVYDYVLYAACQHLGIKVLLFQTTSLPNRILPINRFEDACGILQETYHKLLAQPEETPVVLSEDVKEYIQSLLGDYEDGMTLSVRTHHQVERGKLPHMEPPTAIFAGVESTKESDDKEEVPKKKPVSINPNAKPWTHDWYRAKILPHYLRWVRPVIRPILPALRRLILPLLKPVLELVFFDNTRSYEGTLKRPGQKIERSLIETRGALIRYRLNTRFNFEKRRQRRYHKQNIRRLLERYNTYVEEDLPLDEPFIYVTLHYQPEKSTSPDGGLFVSQRLMLALLSKYLPDGWSLYVKEHPVLLSYNNSSAKGERGRIRAFYDDIAKLRGVKFVPLDLDSFKLIDHAQAVATITGTAGWEAVVRGKPSIVFGYAWYRDCEGVFNGTTEKSCREAMERIAAGYQPDRRKVQLFIQAVEETAILGYTIRFFALVGNLTQEENVANLTRAIVETYERFREQEAPELISEDKVTIAELS
jgi:hypothetical protein